LRRIPNIEIDSIDDHFSARPPHEAAAENIGVQGTEEDTNPPERKAGLHQAFAGFCHHLGWARCGSRTVDQPVDDFVQIGCVHDAAFAAQVLQTSRRVLVSPEQS